MDLNKGIIIEEEILGNVFSSKLKNILFKFKGKKIDKVSAELIIERTLKKVKKTDALKDIEFLVNKEVLKVKSKKAKDSIDLKWYDKLWSFIKRHKGKISIGIILTVIMVTLYIILGKRNKLKK